MDNPAWKAFDTSTEAGRLLKKLYGNKPPPVNVPLPRKSNKPPPNKSEWRPCNNRVADDVVDPRKATRSKEREAQVAKVRKARQDPQYSMIDLVDRRRSRDAIDATKQDIQMRMHHYRPAHQRSVSTQNEKDRYSEICEYKGGRILPDEMTAPIHKVMPSEALSKKKEEERIQKVWQRRRGQTNETSCKPAVNSSLQTPATNLVNTICEEIEERRKYLIDMEELGSSPEEIKDVAFEIKSRVQELKRIDPKAAASFT